MAVHARGCHLTDDSGRELIDLNNNFTSLIHGSAHPDITAAICEAAQRGTAFGLPNMMEVDHAQLMMERLRFVDQIRYANSGTEAMMLAIRLARAVTGRTKVVFVRMAYHGHSDTALVPGGAHSRRGVPAGIIDDTIEVPVNEGDVLAEVLDRHATDIAAVIIDPMPNRAGLVAISAQFWQTARSLTASTGAILIADEVVTLRLGYQGAAMSAGVAPDLIVMGKIIGGGTPIGAVAGTAQYMSELDPLRGGLEHGGTFSGNPMTMAAGMAAIRLFPQSEVDRMNALGNRLRAKLAPLDSLGWEVRGEGSLFRAFPRELSPEDVRRAQKALWWQAYENGLLLTPNGLGSLSTPMGDETIDDVAERLVDAVKATLRVMDATTDES